MLERRTSFRAVTLSGCLMAALSWASSVSAETPLRLEFVTHAAFFSAETKQPKVVDPHVFVKDAAAVAATGPQGIKHAAGIRPALVNEDPMTAMVFTAEDKPLGFSLGTWLGATGQVIITERDGSPKTEATFTGLLPNGQYSVFENHFDQKPVGFTPADGTGQTNSFVAQPDGSAKFTMSLPHVPTHENAVLLVYHSDRQTHGTERGQIGVDAHHQLIARPE